MNTFTDIHEHQNPDAEDALIWNEPVIIADLSGPPNNWDEQTIRTNVLDKYEVDHIRGTDWDPKSIMQYFYPASWTKNAVALTENHNLSETDKQFLKEMYPHSTELNESKQSKQSNHQTDVSSSDFIGKKRNKCACPSETWIIILTVVVILLAISLAIVSIILMKKK